MHLKHGAGEECKNKMDRITKDERKKKHYF